MALSEEEQRLLDELEASLVADDPKLARTMRDSRPAKIYRRSAALGGLGFLVGIVLLIAGIQLNPIISVIGFAVMLVSSIMSISSWRHVNDFAPEAGPESGPSTNKVKTTNGRDFMNRLEERWRRRQEGDN